MTTPQTAQQINCPQIGSVDHSPSPPTIGALLRRVEELEKDLADCLPVFSEAIQVLDDWVTVHAAEFASEEGVKQAWQRINDGGGTIAYASEMARKIKKLHDNIRSHITT